VYKILTVLLLLFSTAAIAEEKKPLLTTEPEVCLPFVYGMNMLKGGDYVPFLRKRKDDRVDEVIYSVRHKRAVQIWYNQPDKTKLPEQICIGKVWVGFEITDQFIVKMKEYIENPEMPI
jgi:hypothetical protein